MITNFFNSIKYHLLVFILIVLTVFAYLHPILEGNIVQAGDAISSFAWNKEVIDYEKLNNVEVNWNNSMFSGMPWKLLTVGEGNNIFYHPYKYYSAFLQYPIGTFIKLGFFCYLSLFLLGLSKKVSFLGAQILIFSTVYTILLAAGHQAKIEVIANFPLILSGVILAFRNKPLHAFVLVSFGVSSAILHNHIQMFYYFFIALTFIGIPLLIAYAIKEKMLNTLKTVSILLIAVVVGVLSNFSMLYSSKSFSEDTMRGKAILKPAEVSIEDKSKEEGLSWDYAMNWSNGFKDLFATIIPNFVGGSSAEEITPESETGILLSGNKAKLNTDGTYSAPMYWGNLPGASGPIYLGAIVVFFFLLFFFGKDHFLKIGFALAILTIFVISLGSNASFFNKLLYNYLPLFDKFRAPSSIMSILPVFVIFPAMFSLNDYLETKAKDIINKKHLYYTFGILASLAVFLLILGTSLFSFTNPSLDSQTLGDSYQVLEIVKNTRKELFKSDVLRFLIMIVLIFASIWLYLTDKFKNSWAPFIIIAVVNLFDLWVVDARYLDSDNFKTYDQMVGTAYAPSPASQQIFSLEPKGRGYYRVMNLSTNTFNDAVTSYHHNSIGGYSAIKIRRYQDIIEKHLSNGNMQVINMLNAKYFIMQDGKLQINGNANGNAWFVKELLSVNSPEEEIEKLNSIGTDTQAVILASEFQSELTGKTVGNGIGSIELIEYAPGLMKYRYESGQDQLAVFSEVWYGPNKGWKATINNEELSIVRLNYILRGLFVPAGSNEIVFSFEPKPKWPLIAIVFSSIIGLSLIFLVYNGLANKTLEK